MKKNEIKASFKKRLKNRCIKLCKSQDFTRNVTLKLQSWFAFCFGHQGAAEQAVKNNIDILLTL